MKIIKENMKLHRYIIDLSIIAYYRDFNKELNLILNCNGINSEDIISIIYISKDKYEILVKEE